MCRKESAEKIDKAVFPGLQGGPHNHTTAAIAVALKEAATPAFKDIWPSGRAQREGVGGGTNRARIQPVSGGTDNHLLLIDLTNKKIIGKKAAQALDRAGSSATRTRCLTTRASHSVRAECGWARRR